MATVQNELITKFSFLGNLSPLNNFNKGLTTSVIKLVTFTTAISATALAFGKLIHNTLVSSDDLVQLSRSTGVAVSSIQQLSFAASVSGSSIKVMEGTIDSLTRKIGDASLRGSSDFQRIGVAVRTSTGEVRKADDVLLDIAKRFKELNLSLAQQKSIAGSLGIDASLIQLLSKSTDEIDRLRERSNKFGLLTKANADQIANYNEKMAELKFASTALRQNLAIKLAPALLSIFSAVDVLSGGIKRITGFVVAFAKETRILTPLLIGISGYFIAMNAPVVAVIAGITAMVAIVDDLIVAFKGGNSVLKKWAEPFFDLQIVLEKIVSYFKLIGSLRAKAFGAVKDYSFGAVRHMFTNTPSKETNNNVEQNISIDIKSDNPQAVGESVNNALQKQLENARLQFDRGGI